MSRIVSIQSFRRGVGKSNLGANIAVLMAMEGRRVGMIDMNIRAPSLHTLFGLQGDAIEHTLNDYLRDRCTLDQAVYRVPSLSLETKNGGQIYLIPASVEIGEIAWALRQGVDVELLDRSLRTLIKGMALDVLLVDTYAGLDQGTLFSMAIADMLVVVLCPSQQDYQGTAVTIDVARKLQVPGVVLVVNQVPKGVDIGAMQSQVKDVFDCPVAALLPYCDRLAALASAGIFALRYRDHAFTTKLQGIVRQLLV